MRSSSRLCSRSFSITFVIRTFYIPSVSMVPTLQVRDVVLVDEIAYRFHAPADGDIAIFRPPVESGGNDFVKRVIGVPGDAISISNGVVYRNGSALRESYENQPPRYDLAIRRVRHLRRRQSARSAQRRTYRRARCGRSPTEFRKASTSSSAITATIRTTRTSGDSRRRAAHLPPDLWPGASYALVSSAERSRFCGRWAGLPSWRSKPHMTPYELLAIVAVIGVARAILSLRPVVAGSAWPQHRHRARVLGSVHHRGHRGMDSHHVRGAHLLHSLRFDVADPANPRRAARGQVRVPLPSAQRGRHRRLSAARPDARRFHQARDRPPGRYAARHRRHASTSTERRLRSRTSRKSRPTASKFATMEST